MKHHYDVWTGCHEKARKDQQEGVFTTVSK